MGFPRQEHWSGLPFPSPGDLPKDSTLNYVIPSKVVPCSLPPCFKAMGNWLAAIDKSQVYKDIVSKAH